MVVRDDVTGTRASPADRVHGHAVDVDAHGIAQGDLAGLVGADLVALDDRARRRAELRLGGEDIDAGRESRDDIARAGVVPPTILEPGVLLMRMPRLDWPGMSVWVPVASVPMRLPWTTLLVAPGPMM